MNFAKNIILMNVKWIQSFLLFLFSTPISHLNILDFHLLKKKLLANLRYEKFGSIVKLFKQSIVPRNGNKTNCVHYNMHPDVASTHTFCPLSSGAVSYKYLTTGNRGKVYMFWEGHKILLSYVVPVKSKVKISQNFVAFSEYMNFIIKVTEPQDSLAKKYSLHNVQLPNKP